ncbi:MAG TPA: hypothetical protein VFK13_16150 [Gemmatimonadaceae bacterium]|nr:hypothetical protein [Gemmatimonadaceae bacterium]
MSDQFGIGKIRVGDIREVWGKRTAIVVFIGDDDWHGDDVRVVPCYLGSRDFCTEHATHRDLVIPAEENGVGVPILAQCWNARCVSSADLSLSRLAPVSDKALKAVRATELVGLVPDPDEDGAAWRGVPLVADDDPRVDWQRQCLRDWDNLQDMIAWYRQAHGARFRRERPWLDRHSRVLAESGPIVQEVILKDAVVTPVEHDEGARWSRVAAA